MRRDLISIVEAGYRLEVDEPEWLSGILESVRPLLDAGAGVIGWSFRDHGRTRTAPICVGCAPEYGIGVEKAHGIIAERMSRAYGHRRLFSTLGQRLGGRGLREYPQIFERWRAGGIADFAALEASDVDGSGVILGAPVAATPTYAPHTVRMWERLGGHLASALRLRRDVARGSAASEPEAVVTTAGHVEHASGRAAATDARQALRSAAISAERARGRLRRDEPDRALGLWKGLVEARWSLVDRFDRGGRRYLVAMKNDPVMPHPRALTERERHVVALAALGRSNKSIAYELGLSVGVIGAYMATAMRKLKIASRVELVRMYAMLGPKPE